MGFAKWDAVAVFVEEPPQFDYVRGMFHIRQRYSDGTIIERVMPPEVFAQALLLAEEARAKWQLAHLGDNVTAIRRGGPHAAA